MSSMKRVAVVGGGMAGVSIALALGSLGVETTLIEQKESLVDGPPFCHLHAGGNLYREISDEQCQILLRQSLEFARLYPFAVDHRPTVIALPLGEVGDLLPRLELLRRDYEHWVLEDPSLRQIGDPKEYFHLFERTEIEALARLSPVETPRSPQEWMIPVAKHLNLESIKWPLILVNEPGLNMFSFAAGVGLALEKMPAVEILRSTQVSKIRRKGEGFELELQGERNSSLDAEYLINAAGFRTGIFDDMLGISQNRMVEFKAAYTSIWKKREALWPEIIFHGERGTPQGMGQFTPYCGGIVQLHGMTKEITLYPEGLVRSEEASAQPHLPLHLLSKIEEGWPRKELEERTRRAIEHLARFLPDFSHAELAGPPLFGAQQIPGKDASLRVAEVAFPLPRYARCEIVKVSSVTDMNRAILQQIEALGWIDPSNFGLQGISELSKLSEEEIGRRAKHIAKTRGYPESMARRCVFSMKETK